MRFMILVTSAFITALSFFHTQIAQADAQLCYSDNEAKLFMQIRRAPLCENGKSPESLKLFFEALERIMKDCPTDHGYSTVNNQYVSVMSPEISKVGYKDCVGFVTDQDPGIPSCTQVWCN